jgi:hypothetical protein
MRWDENREGKSQGEGKVVACVGMITVLRAIVIGYVKLIKVNRPK